ncbi:MAG TPA: CoB--CoM heterodisulfide reductase iron-sulfur subunit B family protein [Methanomassiliicoccales archaeon]
MNRKYYLFRGCLIPTRLPFLERSSLFVLEKLGVEHEQMPGATCCVEPIGLRSLAADTWLVVTARMLAIAESNGRDILSLCNGCYLSLEESRQALENERTRADVNTILKEMDLRYSGNVRVRHFAEIVEEAGADRVRSLVSASQERLRLAAHPGCHMVRPSSKLKIDDSFAPKILDEIASWCGSEVVVSEKWPKCCGGGIAGIDEKVSSKMLEDATSSFRPGGANCILTPCPFCFVQFDIRQKEGLPVLYLAELLALAFGATPEQIGLRYHKTRLP